MQQRRGARVTEVSNELELCVSPVNKNTSAATIIRAARVPLTPEVNLRDVVELNVSLKPDVRSLNRSLPFMVKEVVETGKENGCEIYGGSSVIADTSRLQPREYRTTMLSMSLGRGLLDITSQQVVIGVDDEDFGFRLYNNFRKINPVLLALSASSPLYVRDGGELGDTEHQSRRIPQYMNMCRRLPTEMYRDEPKIETMKQYSKRLRNVSDRVNRLFKERKLDANFEAIANRNGQGFFPFDQLLPHQLYNPTRIRPDHSNTAIGGASVMSIELRVCDIPTTTLRMMTLNSFALGLAYYIQETGRDLDVPDVLNGQFDHLMTAAKFGFDAQVNGQTVGEIARELRVTASQGLKMVGFSEEAQDMDRMVDHVIRQGNDAQRIVANAFETPEELRAYLVERLRKGE
jgi:gamma-glutamyl:cysteine ligase YbdK (ATP-grasp superfamily)